MLDVCVCKKFSFSMTGKDESHYLSNAWNRRLNHGNRKQSAYQLYVKNVGEMGCEKDVKINFLEEDNLLSYAKYVQNRRSWADSLKVVVVTARIISYYIYYRKKIRFVLFLIIILNRLFSHFYFNALQIRLISNDCKNK